MKGVRSSPPSPSLASGLLRQHLDGLEQDQLTVHALSGHKAHLTGGCEKLVQALEGATLAVGDPVVAEITEGDGLCAGGNGRNIGRGVDRTVQDGVGSPSRKGGLPQILPLVVLQLTDGLDRGVVHHPDRLPAVGGLQRVEQVDQLIGGDGGGAGGGDTSLGAAGSCEDTGGLAAAIPGKEGFLLLGANAARKLGRDIGGQVKYTVIEQLIRYLQESTQLVRRQGGLTEHLIALGEGILLIQPGGGAMAGYDGNFTVAAGGLDNLGQAAEHIFLLQSLHQGSLKLVRHQVTALAVGAFLQGIADLIGVTLQTHGIPEIPLILIGSTALLLNLRVAGGFAGDGLVDRLAQFGIQSFTALHASDFFTQIGDVLLHTGVGGVILSGQGTLVSAVGVQESLGGVPGLGALLAQFQNSHGSFPPLVFQQIESLVEIVYGAALGFRLSGGAVGFAFLGDLIHEGIDHRCF